MTTRDRIASGFASALERAGDAPELEALRREITLARDHLGQPMRVAIVGPIKAGKSTLVNALLGEDLAPTGTEELTFNVNRLCQGSRAVIVHFKNGRPSQPRTRAELELLVSRRDENADFLRSIDHIEVRDPNPILGHFNLIDTPGLGSHFGADSLNTLRFLGQTVDEVEVATRRESAGADAVVCLFSRNVATREQTVVREFQGSLLGSATPINAVGLLTKVDVYWDPRKPGRDPLQEGHRVASTIAADPAADRIFYAVLPVAGLVGFGARTLTSDEVMALSALAAMRPEELAKRLRDAKRFVEADDLPVTRALRSSLMQRRLGQFGIWLAASVLRGGAGEQELRERLWVGSGLKAVDELLLSHFGRRALLIKAQTGLRRSRAAAFDARQRPTAAVVSAAAEAGGVLERTEVSEPALAELALLRRYYRDPDVAGLSDGEHDELRRTMGEQGGSLSVRLGLDACATPQELSRVAAERLTYWHERQDEFGAEPEAIETARAMARTYERLLYHADAARRHLEAEL